VLLPENLTPCETEVLALIAEGFSNAEIAERLVVSRVMIKSHINHLSPRPACATALRPQLRVPRDRTLM
jgi:FixJ family two-component response regulator